MTKDCKCTNYERELIAYFNDNSTGLTFYQSILILKLEQMILFLLL